MSPRDKRSVVLFLLETINNAHALDIMKQSSGNEKE